MGILLVVLLGCASSQAAEIISFDQFLAAGGSITYDGIGGGLVGTNIPFDVVRGLGTPLNAGTTLACAGCMLNFTTGANNTEGPNYTWGAAPFGSFTVTGGIAALGIAAGSILLQGEITVADYSTITDRATVVGFDEKHPDLVAFFFGATDPNFRYVNTEITLGAFTPTGGGGFIAEVTNADIDNVTFVPEPGSLLLILLGLGGITAYNRRRVA